MHFFFYFIGLGHVRGSAGDAGELQEFETDEFKLEFIAFGLYFRAISVFFAQKKLVYSK